MEILKNVVLAIHIIGVASLLGGVLVQISAIKLGKTRILPAIVHGAWTMLVGGWRALRQHDIKLILAFGTVSQLGLLTAIAGIGTKAAGVCATGSWGAGSASCRQMAGAISAIPC